MEQPQGRQPLVGKPEPRANRRSLLVDLALLAIIAVGAWLRLTGVGWDENQHMHPDERFLAMVETSIRPPESLSQYFNTAESPLNPHNVGHTFFVYGTLPIFLVRFLAEWTNNAGYDQVTLVGRVASAAFDLLSIYLIYRVGAALYRRRVGLLAAAFYALCVLPIQHAHFFVVESFTTAFLLACMLFAVRVQQRGAWADYLLFGLSLGMAVASKISAAPVAAVLVLAGAAHVLEAPVEERAKALGVAMVRMVAAAGISLLAFRVFQPYAFSGPSFFGILPNPRWLANLSELSHQAGGNVDFPPALQWANRAPIIFALQNLVVWGMGLPLGIAAWLGWGWAAARMARGEWRPHLLPVVWTGGYFLWQSTGFTPAMRYQLPVYPTLTLLASWALWRLWDLAALRADRLRRWARVAAAAAGGVVLLGTAAWAVAFASIYSRPMTRVAASRWIYGHVPGVVNLVVSTDEGEQLAPVPMPLEFTLQAETPHLASFTSRLDGEARAIVLPFVTDLGAEPQTRSLSIALMESPDPASAVATASYTGSLPHGSEGSLEIPLDPAWALYEGRTYYLLLTLHDSGRLAIRGGLTVVLNDAAGSQSMVVALPEADINLASGESQTIEFRSPADGTTGGLLLPHVSGWETVAAESTLEATLYEVQDTGPQDLARAVTHQQVMPAQESALSLAFDQPVLLAAGGTYGLRLHLVSGPGLAMRGSVIVSESSWDDGLPLGVDGRGMGGVYTGVIEELYWPDDQDDDQNGISDKRQRILDTLTQGDYLIITSNRQYGTIPRVPARYPLTTAYYRALLGCPDGESVLTCGATALPGSLVGDLGYELVAVFDSHPHLGTFSINDQFAEEAFTVYDHPRVLIFARGANFSREHLDSFLAGVDTSQVLHLLPGEVGARPPDLMLPVDRLAEQRAGGTWSELFDLASPLNRSQPLAVVAWWVTIGVIGLAAVPLTRLAFPSLADGGYPLARLVGLLVVAWGSWLLGSLRVPFGRATILGTALLMAVISAWLVWRDREGWARFVRERKREIVWTEVLALAFFALDLAIRLGNPDLWHPSKGGEKPMDLSYLTAVLRSTSFPPYDPWFAGGYINYYYYGFVLIAVPIRLLGLQPTIAYNLAIPTIFAVLALSAYSLGYNLLAGRRREQPQSGVSLGRARRAGLAAAIALVILGNLGNVRMLYEGLKRMGAPPGQEPATFALGLAQAATGAVRYATFQGTLPYALDSWYWDPSRAIPPGEGEVGAITEFPFFTFLYADLHAHMISRPIAILALAWCLSWLASADERRRWRRAEILATFFVGGLALGALRPTNLSDYPTYWGLGGLAVVVAAWLRHRRLDRRAVQEALIGVVGLLGLAYLLYLPYHLWYGQAYGAVKLWDGAHTPVSAYLVVHGAFLFAIVAWMTWETREWMATTPLSELARLRPAFGSLVAAAGGLLVVTLFLMLKGIVIAWIVVPVIVWAGILALRPGLALEKRFVLVLTAAATALTFLVEVVVTVGDISRMNTVFKFYLQVWEMFALAAAAAVVWTSDALPAWRPAWRRVWVVAVTALVLGAALYPLIASVAKIRDRWSSAAPHTLDGMAYMPFVTYFDVAGPITLAEDQAAIRWLQSEVQGSPVIVEANVPEYRWGSRMTVYTGLPGVLGWNWHQRQQRALAGDPTVFSRAEAITSFYVTPSIDEARDFLARYQVRYVIVGQLERMYYGQWQPCVAGPDGGMLCDMSGRPPLDGCYGLCPVEIPPEACHPVDAAQDPLRLVCPTGGLAKFDQMVAQGLLEEGFREGETIIYEVVE